MNRLSIAGAVVTLVLLVTGTVLGLSSNSRPQLLTLDECTSGVLGGDLPDCDESPDSKNCRYSEGCEGLNQQDCLPTLSCVGCLKDANTTKCSSDPPFSMLNCAAPVVDSAGCGKIAFTEHCLWNSIEQKCYCPLVASQFNCVQQAVNGSDCQENSGPGGNGFAGMY